MPVHDFRRNIVPRAGSAEGFTTEFENGAFERTGIFGAVRHTWLGLTDESGNPPTLERENTESIRRRLVGDGEFGPEVPQTGFGFVGAFDGDLNGQRLGLRALVFLQRFLDGDDGEFQDLAGR